MYGQQTSGWAPAGPAAYGLSYGAGSPAAGTGLESVPTPSAEAIGELQLWNPANPLFIFGVLAAATFGLMAVSTAVRVGPAKVSASLGKA